MPEGDVELRALACAWSLQGFGSLRRAVQVSGQLPRVIPSLHRGGVGWGVAQKSEGVRMEYLSVPGHGGTER